MVQNIATDIIIYGTEIDITTSDIIINTDIMFYIDIITNTDIII